MCVHSCGVHVVRILRGWILLQVYTLRTKYARCYRIHRTAVDVQGTQVTGVVLSIAHTGEIEKASEPHDLHLIAAQYRDHHNSMILNVEENIRSRLHGCAMTRILAVYRANSPKKQGHQQFVRATASGALAQLHAHT